MRGSDHCRSASTAHGRWYFDPLRCLPLTLRADAMKRRSRAGGERVKARHRKTVTRQNAPKVRPRRSIAGTHQTDLAQVIGERDEALEQQAAISDILRIISNSPSDVQLVLDSVTQH